MSLLSELVGAIPLLEIFQVLSYSNVPEKYFLCKVVKAFKQYQGEIILLDSVNKVDT
jgi:hypothetical protein